MFRVVRTRPPTLWEKGPYNRLASKERHIVEQAAGILGRRFDGVRACRMTRGLTMKAHP